MRPRFVSFDSEACLHVRIPGQRLRVAVASHCRPSHGPSVRSRRRPGATTVTPAVTDGPPPAAVSSSQWRPASLSSVDYGWCGPGHAIELGIRSIIAFRVWT